MAMIEPRPHLIRAGRGRVRVLRLACDGSRCYPLRYHARPGAGMCRNCGCTRQYACAGGCGWANAARTVCTKCEERICR